MLSVEQEVKGEESCWILSMSLSHDSKERLCF